MNRIVFCKNIKEIYRKNCSEFATVEVEEVAFHIIPMALSISCIFYLKNNTHLLSELLFRITYNSFLAAAKMSNVCRKLKNYFGFGYSNIDVVEQKTYIYDEIKVIKNGVRHASFETMATFKQSCYLGNPNEYCDIEEIVDYSSLSSSSSSSSSSFESDIDTSSPSSPASSCDLKTMQPEPLFIMEKNECDNTLHFKDFDFIMHTNYRYPELPQTSKQHYTRIYRTFTENDYAVNKHAFEISKAEMILCTLEMVGVENGSEYDIDLLHPYNFNVVGNIILDEKFVHWYILKKYNYAIDRSVKYKITCITRDIKVFELDRSCGLRVNSNEYEKVDQPLVQ
jgi:hypothetical protein